MFLSKISYENNFCLSSFIEDKSATIYGTAMAELNTNEQHSTAIVIELDDIELNDLINILFNSNPNESDFTFIDFANPSPPELAEENSIDYFLDFFDNSRSIDQPITPTLHPEQPDLQFK